jgi:acyl carrier protein
MNNTRPTISTAEALAMLAECFNLPAEDLHPALEREAVDDWDSMGALMLIAEIDERFGLELSAEVSREMTRIGDVLDFLRTHGVLREGD